MLINLNFLKSAYQLLLLLLLLILFWQNSKIHLFLSDLLVCINYTTYILSNLCICYTAMDKLDMVLPKYSDPQRLLLKVKQNSWIRVIICFISIFEALLQSLKPKINKLVSQWLTSFVCMYLLDHIV